MTSWTSDELDRVAAAEELELAVRGRDGTLRKPVTIWVVRDGDDLYVRSWRGHAGAWYRGAQDRHEGRIRAGGVDRGVALIPVGDEVNDAVDAAYRSKYQRHGDSYVAPMTSGETRMTTLRLDPRPPEGRSA